MLYITILKNTSLVDVDNALKVGLTFLAMTCFHEGGFIGRQGSMSRLTCYVWFRFHVIWLPPALLKSAIIPGLPLLYFLIGMVWQYGSAPL